MEVSYRNEIGLVQKAQQRNQNGMKNDPMTIESRNNRITRKREKKARTMAKKSHSCVPG